MPNEPKEYVCYCLGYSKADIERDLAENNGRSTIVEKITFNRRQGLCECEVKHPEKR